MAKEENTEDNNQNLEAEEDKFDVLEINDPNTGKLSKKISTKNNIPHGETILYDDSGNISHKLNYENGELSGPAEFFLNGQPQMITAFKNGLQEGETTFFSNGIKIGKVNIVKGLFEGEFISYDAVGNIIRVANYSAGQQNGECNNYYADGVLMQNSTYKNNMLDGQVVRYFPDGNVMEISEFDMGKPVGVVDTYDQKGHLISRREV